jgi:hypothetical protein
MKWILYHDPDETLDLSQVTPEGVHRVLALPEAPLAFLLTIRSPTPGGGCEEALAPRLFRAHRGLRYEFPIHEQLGPLPNVLGTCDLILHHEGYRDPAILRAKQERNLRLLRTMPEDHPHRLYFEARTTFSLGRWEESASSLKSLIALRGGTLPWLEADLYFSGGLSLLRLGRIEEAWELVTCGLEFHPQHQDLRFTELVLKAWRFLDQSSEEQGREEQRTLVRELMRACGLKMVEQEGACSGA